MTSTIKQQKPITIESELAELFGEVQTYYYIIKDGPNSGWRTAIDKYKGIDKKLPCEWSSMYKAWYYGLPLSKAVIKSAYKNAETSKKLIGRRPSSKNNYIVIDVDAPIQDKRQGSRYHPSNSLEEWSRLIMLVKDRIGENIITVRSSESGGYHIYIFFDQWINSDRIAHRVKNILAQEGIYLAKGQIEIFPNIRESDDSQFNGIRLPCLTQDSYVIDPFTLERVGYRQTFVEMAKERNNVNLFLNREAPQKPILRDKSKIVIALPVTDDVKDEEEFIKKKKDRPFNLASKFHWTSENRTNGVSGAHVAYAIERLGLTDPDEIEKVVWERLYEYGYEENASKEEKQDRGHVRRWIKHRLEKGDVSPLSSVTGSGDTRLNELRSEDSKARFNYAINAAKKAGITFPSWNQMFKWVNRWLAQRYLATIGSTTWEKLKRCAYDLINPSTVDNNAKGVENLENISDTGSPSPPEPPFKSIFGGRLLELGKSFLDSVSEIMGGDYTIAPQVVQYLVEDPPI